MSIESEKAYFAAGCFWCIQEVLDKQKGVISTTVGYMGGSANSPTYEEVCSGKTGHAEAIEVNFNPKELSYEKLLKVFWDNIDPTTKNQQYCDIGSQYRTIIFYSNEKQKKAAEESKKELEKSLSVETEIIEAVKFFPAEEYHQKYYLKHQNSYKFYHDNSGR